MRHNLNKHRDATTGATWYSLSGATTSSLKRKPRTTTVALSDCIVYNASDPSVIIKRIPRKASQGPTKPRTPKRKVRVIAEAPMSYAERVRLYGALGDSNH